MEQLSKQQFSDDLTAAGLTASDRDLDAAYNIAMFLDEAVARLKSAPSAWQEPDDQSD